MKWLQRLKSKLNPDLDKSLALPGADEISSVLADLKQPVKPGIVRARPSGRVIKRTRHNEFNPDARRTGGRVVTVMPRKLQKIKQAQEMVEDDSKKPSVEDLED